MKPHRGFHEPRDGTGAEDEGRLRGVEAELVLDEEVLGEAREAEDALNEVHEDDGGHLGGNGDARNGEPARGGRVVVRARDGTRPRHVGGTGACGVGRGVEHLDVHAGFGALGRGCEGTPAWRSRARTAPPPGLTAATREDADDGRWGVADAARRPGRRCPWRRERALDDAPRRERRARARRRRRARDRGTREHRVVALWRVRAVVSARGVGVGLSSDPPTRRRSPRQRWARAEKSRPAGGSNNARGGQNFGARARLGLHVGDAREPLGERRARGDPPRSRAMSFAMHKQVHPPTGVDHACAAYFTIRSATGVRRTSW